MKLVVGVHKTPITGSPETPNSLFVDPPSEVPELETLVNRQPTRAAHGETWRSLIGSYRKLTCSRTSWRLSSLRKTFNYVHELKRIRILQCGRSLTARTSLPTLENSSHMETRDVLIDADKRMDTMINKAGVAEGRVRECDRKRRGRDRLQRQVRKRVVDIGNSTSAKHNKMTPMHRSRKGGAKSSVKKQRKKAAEGIGGGDAGGGARSMKQA